MLLPHLQKATEGRDFAAVHPVSAHKRTGLEAPVAALLALMPEQPPLYAQDEHTAQTPRFIAGALVRAQLKPNPGAKLTTPTPLYDATSHLPATPLRSSASLRDG